MKEANQGRMSRGLVFIQALLGFGATVFLALPYLRRTHGLDRLQPSQKYLFVANHVSLLDTILLGGLCWRSGCYPILTLGDKNVWHNSWIKRLLSSRIGFLLERGKLNPGRIRELREFGRAGKKFHLLVFPEGTRGDGVNVASSQPGIYFVAQEARLPIVPVFIENMQLVSTKNGKFHLIGGLRKIEVHYGEPIVPEKYLALPREEFLKIVQRSIMLAKQSQPEARAVVVKSARLSVSNSQPVD
jgi:1-acyl-sn-glycerol-3-phosphate acyltransferase